MNKMIQSLRPLRKGVIAYVQDEEGKILISQNADYGPRDWTFPGGGIDKGETAESAVIRELAEELAIKSSELKILRRSKKPLVYEFDKRYLNSSTHVNIRYFRGQIKIQFHILFTGQKDRIKIDKKELRKIKWVEVKDLKQYLRFDNQLTHTIEVLKEFGVI